jgi:hypothetical protein
MEDFFPLFLIVVFLAFGVVMTIWTFVRGRQILEGWAAENGYQLDSAQSRWLRCGPFFWTSSKGQMICYVVIRLPDGRTRRGWGTVRKLPLGSHVRQGGSEMGSVASAAVLFRTPRRWASGGIDLPYRPSYPTNPSVGGSSSSVLAFGGPGNDSMAAV